jgi:outer membrane protein assembly factor BamD
MKVWSLRFIFALVVMALASSCGFKHKKFENPIVNDSEQPDKQIFDKAIKDIGKGRYEVARLQLQVLLS